MGRRRSAGVGGGLTALCLSRSGCAEGYARDATEIQNIQIAEGDVCRCLPIPIYMVFPRLFTCPTLETTNFKIGRFICVSANAGNLFKFKKLSFRPNVSVFVTFRI